MYLDFHTHHIDTDEDVINFYNIDLRKGPVEFKKGDHQCLGLHPWDLTEKYLEKLDSFEFLFLEAEVTCLGEMGLDRAKKEIDFELQKKVFSFQLNVASQRKDSFVIIHCVKAFPDILECVKKSNFKGKLVFHDYNGDEQVTKELVKKGHYFSYGNMLFFKNSKGYKSLQHIPIEQLFLETDDHRRFSIKDAYKEFARIRGVELDELKDQVMANFEKILS